MITWWWAQRRNIKWGEVHAWRFWKGWPRESTEMPFGERPTQPNSCALVLRVCVICCSHLDLSPLRNARVGSVLQLVSPWPAGVQPQQDPGVPSEWTVSANERERQSLGLSLKFIFARLLYTLNNIFGGSAYCLHTGHLKTLQQLDLQQKLDVTHIVFYSQESVLSFGLQAC